MNNLNKLNKIADQVKLNQSQKTLFVKYMDIRFDLSSEEYLAEWALRFKNGKEFEKSDLQGQKILKLLAPSLYTI